MTGKELIIYILQNNLENDTIFETISESEAAVKFEVGVDTIRIWYALGLIKGLVVDGNLLIWDSGVNPKKR